jgi:hypothetical protein
MLNVSVSMTGLDKIIEDVQKRNSKTDAKLRTLCEKLAEIGISFMEPRFRLAFYDGVNDTEVNQPEWVSDTVLEIPVTGHSVAFIEFGTGVHYPDTHPKAAELGAIRGEFGQKKGRRNTWKYYGDPGTLGWYGSAKDKAKGLVSTHGNPANQIMYRAAAEMRQRILEIARSVFADD